MVARFAAMVCLVVCGSAVPVHAAMVLGLECDTYFARPGDVLELRILLDVDDAAAGWQAPAAGLFSAGAAVRFAPALGAVADVSDILLPGALSENGAGAPARREVAPGFAGFFGGLLMTLDPFTQGYGEPLLATVRLQVALGATGSFPIQLDTYFPAPMSNLVTCDAQSLDDEVEYRPSTVVLIPEPLALCLVGVGSVAMLSRRRARLGRGPGHAKARG